MLTFIGVKMLLPLISLGLAYALNRAGATTLAEYAKRGDHISIGIALGIVAIVLVGSVAASLIWPKVDAREIDVDLPPDFDPPFADTEVEKPVVNPETVKHP